MFLAEYPLKAVCDTSVYIPFINQGIAHPVFSEKSFSPVLYMSAVVLSELYAGAHDQMSIKLLDKLYRTFQDVGRLIVPANSDWRQTGSIIVRLRKKYGYEAGYLSRLQNDMLIACSARGIGAFVFTRNERDFQRIREFMDFHIFGQK
ncbi:MAG: type II toxin-antitoxin system VapC family toxin [Nitrospiraceae bacterium]|nr:type II toxin-antitoxin system VapC family toxin [Nitrospiraceae bacterium]